MSSALAKRIKNRRYVGDAEERPVDEDLLVIGYSCTIFRDDEKAEFIDEERHLIVHPVDITVTTDRYDGRLCLHDLYEYDSGKIGQSSESGSDGLRHQDEDADETELELERYRDLIAAEDDLEDNYEPYASPSMELTGMTSNESPADSPIGTDNEGKEKQSRHKQRQFTPPDELELPSGMIPPATSHMHAIIAKTAGFVATKGPQMEIIIKAKQKTKDHHFQFLEFDDVLRPYYDHLLKMVKNGKYRFVEEEEESDEDSDGGDYLHPSLMISASTSTTAKTVEKQSEKTETETQQQPQPQPQQQTTADEPATVDLQPIMDRLADYVARNGDAFEDVVRSRQDPLYSFIEPHHQYNRYYRQRVNFYRSEQKQMAESKPQQSSQHSASNSPSTLTLNNDKSEKRASRRDSPGRKSRKANENSNDEERRRKKRRRDSSDEERRRRKRKDKKKSRKRRKSSPARSEDDVEEESGRKRSTAIKFATFVPVPASEENRKITDGNGAIGKKETNDGSSPISDNAVKCSLGVDEGNKEKSDDSVKKMQEERRAKAKIFLRLIRDRDQSGSKIVNIGKPWDDD